ncbi:mRNA turnover 4 [Trapelia coarctata]|nr:mRNA turnover 4 [Trapelia coarctata]
MPRSKRAKIIHTSKTTKKGKQLTLKTFAAIQASTAQYPHLYVFAVDNMRNSYLKDVRAHLSSSRLFFGKTKVMAAALGRDASTEPAPQTSLLAPQLVGAVGLLFSEHGPEYVREYFAGFMPMDYARAGTVATRSFVIPSGVVYSRGGEVPAEEDVPMAHSMEPGLRKLGVPTRLVKGKIVLGDEGGEGYTVCKEGEVLGSGQTTLLKMFGVATAEFRVVVKAYWSRDSTEVVVLGGEGKGQGSGGMEIDGDDELVDDEE